MIVKPISFKCHIKSIQEYYISQPCLKRFHFSYILYFFSRQEFRWAFFLLVFWSVISLFRPGETRQTLVAITLGKKWTLVEGRWNKHALYFLCRSIICLFQSVRTDSGLRPCLSVLRSHWFWTDILKDFWFKGSRLMRFVQTAWHSSPICSEEVLFSHLSPLYFTCHSMEKWPWM